VTRATRVLAAVAVACLPLAGCGQSDDRAEVRSVTERFFAALEADDGAAACAALSTDTRAALEDEAQRECREAVTELRLEGGPPTRVQVYVVSAKADFPSGESAFLSRTQEGWRLSAVGCEPQRGKPADEPFDCAAEA
jgi:hypothetical protein